MKACSNCKERKVMDEFYRNRRSKDHRSSWCKECHRRIAREYGRQHKAQVMENTKRWCERNPERARELHREASRRYYLRKKAEKEAQTNGSTEEA